MIDNTITTKKQIFLLLSFLIDDENEKYCIKTLSHFVIKQNYTKPTVIVVDTEATELRNVWRQAAKQNMYLNTKRNRFYEYFCS